jgi:hypothetical protein
MHSEAYDFIRRSKDRTFPLVVEFGSRNVNGSVKGLFKDAITYYGIDIAPGRDVDEVCDAGEWQGAYPFDLVICCEVLEHTPRVRAIVRAAARNLHDRGYFFITCATHGRNPHSAIDGGPVREGEYYQNVDPRELAIHMRDYGFAVCDVEVHDDRGDLYMIGFKGEN